jgi:hypothetical protein
LKEKNRTFTLAKVDTHMKILLGDLNWQKRRQREAIKIHYGENILTKMLEVMVYQLPIDNQQVNFLSISYNNHGQNSFYGNQPLPCKKEIASLDSWIWGYRPGQKSRDALF